MNKNIDFSSLQNPQVGIEPPDLDTWPSIEEIRPVISSLTYEFLSTKEVLPIRETKDFVLVAMARIDLLTIRKLEIVYRKKVQVFTATLAQIHQNLKELFKIKEPALPEENLPQSPNEELFQKLLLEGIHIGASDIHFEPENQGFIVRYRIDGVLKKHFFGDHKRFQRVISHIKILAQLDIAEHRLPQDGRIRTTVDGKDVDLRVSILPVHGGERVVLRILDQSKTLLQIDQLNMGDIQDDFIKTIKKKEGILLVTGPTGSGKTTTLYSVLEHLNSADINIMTIEDPIEYQIDGVNQLGVRPKIDLDFAKGLRHMLRQDPDIILIGEIRDTETAKIAIQASLTGHLVLSTLHTNDAASAITRLVEMGIERYLLSSSMIGVLAQRLVRLICPHCKTSYTPSTAEMQDLNLNVSLFYKGQGCKHCHGTGYASRQALFEWLPVDDQIRRTLQDSSDSSQLQKVAEERGMITLPARGAALVKAGKTSYEEIMRVLG